MDKLSNKQIEALKECAEIMAKFFWIDKIQINGEIKPLHFPMSRPDDKGWFYVDKETADQFKKAYTKYLYRF